MIDLHCHLCFGVDDGPQSPQDSVDLAKALIDAGVEKVACTSHYRADKEWFNDASAQKANHLSLDKIMDEAGVILPRVTAAEHYLDENTVDKCKNKQVVPYGDSKWILLELPYRYPPPNLMNILYSIRTLGYKIVLAHLERYPYILDNWQDVEYLYSAGYLIQINLGSLCGYYGKDYEKAAIKLVEKEMAGIAASDCHHYKDVDVCVTKGLKKLQQIAGNDTVADLVKNNPQMVLDNK